MLKPEEVRLRDGQNTSKKTDSAQKTKPGTVSLTTLVEEDACFVGRIPLDKLKIFLEQKVVEGITIIDFHANGYITDAVLLLLRDVLCKDKKSTQTLSAIDLTGCFNVTDIGVRWLADVIANSPQLTAVRLDGCTRVTDCGFCAITNVAPSVSISAMATSVSQVNRGMSVRGCPLLVDPKSSKERVDLTYGHTLIVPPSQSETSFADFLQKKNPASNRNGRPLCYTKEWKCDKWKLALTEMDLSNPLFDLLVPSNPAQVLIPFDSGSDIRDIRTHIASTISRVLNKESVNPNQNKAILVPSSKSKDFMEVHVLQKLEFSWDGSIKNISKSETVIGAFVSSQPLSRSNNYFEVKIVDVDKTTEEVGMVMGCMFDVLFSERFPMEASERKGGAVEGFDKFQAGDVYGFGIEGEWESEFVPRDQHSAYYFTKNGDRIPDKVVTETPRIGMYPLLSVLGKGIAHIQLLNLNSPPQSLLKQWEKEKKTFEPCFLHNVFCDEHGVLSYSDNYRTNGQLGTCTNRFDVTKNMNSFSVRVLGTYLGGSINVGIGPENFQTGVHIGHGDSKQYRVTTKACDGIGLDLGEGMLNRDGVKMKIETLQDIKPGDVVTVTVTDIANDVIQPDDTVTVSFYVNGVQVCTPQSYQYKAKLGNRCVFIITIKSSNKVKIMNYRPEFRSPPPVMNKLTMGRSNFINVYDDGRLQYSLFDKRRSFGLFMSKTPLNKELCEFDMTVLNISQQAHVGIGVCHRRYPINNMPGWLQGSIAYHADNGKLYKEAANGTVTLSSDPSLLKFGRGDTVSCGVDVKTTKFTEDGRIEPQQELNMYFTKNGEKVHQIKFMYMSDGLFPCVALHDEMDEVKLNNYFPGLQPVAKQESVEKKVEKDIPEEGCQFVLVSVGSEKSSDEKGKLQKVQKHLNLKKDLACISDLKAEVDRLGKDVSSLDFQGQNQYSRLSWQQQCLERICNHGDRLHFLSVNTDTGQGHDDLLRKIAELHKKHKERCPLEYDIHEFVKKGLDKIQSVVEVHCIVLVSKLKELTEDVLDNFAHVYHQAVVALSRMGRLLCFKLLSGEYVAVDLDFLARMFERLASVQEGGPDKRVTVVGAGSMMWAEDTITSSTKLKSMQLDLLKQLLTLMGLMRLPLLRTEPTDPLYLYTRMDNIVNPAVSMSDYWSQGSCPKDTVIMWRTYQFWSGMPSALLSALITQCSQHARLLLVRQDGGVFQNGAIQTAIVHEKKEGKDLLTMESRCYVPDADMGSINEDTRYHVEEYTWNVFCLLADVIGGYLENCGLTSIIKEEVPSWFGNSSIGCKHEWVVTDDEIVQSICTLCELCCDTGPACKWNGIVGHYLRQCQCGTKVSGCKSCGICKRCAEQLWTLRSSLRPSCEVTNGDKTELSDAVALNGVTFNSVTCFNLHVANQPICLRKQNDTSGALIQVFPGPAVEIPERKKLQEYNKKPTFTKHQQFLPGDRVTISLEEIKRDTAEMDEDQEDDDIPEIKPVYHTVICREARVWHETGLLCYDTTSKGIPVAQFVGARPLSAECNKFSIQVVNPGNGRYIAIGLVHKRYSMDRQPGWDASSIGYHADDGGIFVGSGWPLRRVGAVAVGEIMTCELDEEQRKVKFYKGDEMVYESARLRVPPGGFHPCAAMHSTGEALRLVDLDAWLPPKEVEGMTLPQAFDTYKYGNLWISPGRHMTLQKTGGWLMLHNPSKDLVGYVVKTSPSEFTGHLDPGVSKAIWIDLTETVYLFSAKPDSFTSCEIVWFSLDSGRTYTEEDIQTIHSTLTTESYHTHTLKVKVMKTDVSDVKQLKRQSEGEPEARDAYIMRVSRNDSLVDSYYLKAGKYNCIMPREDEVGKYGILLQAPRFPTFDQPNMFQRGMRLIAQPSQNVYAECVLADVTRDGYGITLEFSPKKSEDNTLLCIEATSEAIQLEDLPLETIEAMSTAIKGEKEAKKELEEKEDNSDGTKGDNSEETIITTVDNKEGKTDGGKGSKSEAKGGKSESKTDEKREAEEKVSFELSLPEDEGYTLLTRSKQIDLDEVDDSSKKSAKKEEKKEIVMADVEIFGYESRGNLSVEKRAYMFPPPCLLTSASRYAIMALDSKWKMNSLESITKCYSVPTRITVQELQITEISRKLPMIIKNRPKDRTVDQAFVFLPSSLDATKLCYSPVPRLFMDIEVHRLCFLVDQLYQFNRNMYLADNSEEVMLDVPIHFVDTPPIKPSNALPPNLMYGCLMSGWNYSVMTATKLILPVYDKVFSGGKPDYTRQQVETLLWSLLRVYTAQCHIFAEQHGGLELQDSLMKRTQDIKKAIAHDDKNVARFRGEFNDDPSMMMIRRFKNSLMCKAHQLSLEPAILYDTDAKCVQYEHKYYQPYQETVNYFLRSLPEQETLPEDFFAKFPNLQVMGLEGCSKLESVPSGISQCSRLRIVNLMSSNIKELPSDIFLAEDLDQLNCINLPVKSLPTQWPASSQLTCLVLSGLQLTRIPVEICQLHELTALNLGHNPLSDVPEEIGQLQKLKILNLCGMPWITLGGSKGLIRKEYDTYFEEHPYIQTYLQNFNAGKMFVEHDLNKNGTLDEEELAVLNLKFFWDIPRIGCRDICDSEYGGIPPAVFRITSLEELYLNFTAITAVPVHMCRLVNLHVLSLDYNPLLESLPGSLGHLPNIKSLNLLGCPSLRTPPNEVVSRGFESVKAYLKRLAGGFTACRRTKLMLVGLGGAGKTSLLKALMSQNRRTEGTKGEDITDGIVIQPWTVKSKDGLDITYNTWDFAGQTLYYNTHQFFLSKRAVYMLLWSTRQGFEHAGLDFWLSSIACHAPKTPIFVIGTHCDQVPKAEIPTARLCKRYPQIAGFHFVSSIEGTGIAELEERLLEVTLEQKNMGEKIPQVWLNLEHKILAARTSTSILKWSVIKDYGMEVGIYDEKDIKEAIQFLHELGTVQYFDNDFLRNQVVINPQWIVNVMSCVVSVKNSPIQDHKGRFHHEYIGEIWSAYPKSLHQWLLQLTEEFDLTFPLPKDPVNIVPCLLPQEEPDELDWSVSDCTGDIRQTKMVYRFAYLPAGLFNRAQVRLFQFSDGKLIWKRGSLLKKNNHLALIRQISDNELVVLVQGPRPENILFLVHEIFESLIDESFHGVVYDFLVPCPDCVMKEGCLEPCLFESELIAHAKDNKAPFLQCRKYFHTVSMAQLLEVMPSSQASDFDAHLQHSIMMLQELNNALTMDVAILYSPSDVPAPKENGDKVHPAWVKEDLEQLGLSCWWCEDMLNVSIQDMTLGLKNCKVVVALVSDNFERDEKCRDMLLYTMDNLHKDYLITVIGNSLAWQTTDLGMRIGKHEQMVMVKTKNRYKDRVKEMQDAVQQKLHGIQIRENKEYPVCFVSYCWSNSQDAVSKGTKPRPGSIGWGDPRQIKKQLEDNGISTWIDFEQAVAGKGLFENICQGMRHARVLLVCVSDEYVESENCMMELRFGVLNLGLPLVLAVVGTGMEWKFSEVGILAQRAKASKVYLQKENPTAMETMLTYVRDRLPKATDNIIRKEALKKEISERQKKTAKQTNVVLQEEYELTQRRFMRHIISYVSSMDTNPMPRLVVIDFDRREKASTTANTVTSRRRTGTLDSPSVPERESSRESNLSRASKLRPTLRPKTATKSRERMEAFRPEEEWESEHFCIKILCEFEEGWHVCEKVFPIRKTEDFKEKLQRLAPYLARIFAILKQSSMPLHCLKGDDSGKQFTEWLEQESQGCDFLEAYQAMQTIISDNQLAADSFLAQLSRCHLPSGKVFWLCEKHQSGPRITKLSRDVGTRLNQRKVIFREDILLKELIEKSAIYLKKRGEKSKAKKSSLPPTDKSGISKKMSGTGITHKPSKENLVSKPSNGGNNNMPPIRSDPKKNDAKKQATSPPPAKMHPVNRSSSKSKFKATGTATEISAAAAKRSGSKESGSKESGSKESRSRESGSKESRSRESGNKESRSKEGGSKACSIQ